MYKGQRDSYLRIRVPQTNCFAVTLSSGEWIEVILPNTRVLNTWESFMVKPEQVFYDLEHPNTFNIIDNINADTKIKIYAKTGTITNRQIITGSMRIVNPQYLIELFSKTNKI